MDTTWLVISLWLFAMAAAAGSLLGLVLALVLPARKRPRDARPLAYSSLGAVAASVLLLVSDIPAVQVIGAALITGAGVALGVWVFWAVRRYRWVAAREAGGTSPQP